MQVKIAISEYAVSESVDPAVKQGVKCRFSRGFWRFPRSAVAGRAWPGPRSTRWLQDPTDLASAGLPHPSAAPKPPPQGFLEYSRAARARAWRYGQASYPA